MNPGLDGEFPAIKMGLHQHGKFLVGNGVHFIRRSDDPMPQTTGFIKSLQVNGVIGVPVQFQQGLIDPFQKAHDVFLVVCFFENSHANAAQLGTTLHQRLVPQQHGLTKQARVIQQDRVDCTGPLHGFFKQRNRHIHAHILQGLGNFHGTIVQPLKVPGHVGDIMLFAVSFGPLWSHHHVATIEFVGRFNGTQGPAQQCDVTFFRTESVLGTHGGTLQTWQWYNPERYRTGPSINIDKRLALYQP